MTDLVALGSVFPSLLLQSRVGLLESIVLCFGLLQRLSFACVFVQEQELGRRQRRVNDDIWIQFPQDLLGGRVRSKLLGYEADGLFYGVERR